MCMNVMIFQVCKIRLRQRGSLKQKGPVGSSEKFQWVIDASLLPFLFLGLVQALLPPWQRRLCLVALVCLSVYLFVDNITQQVMNRLG